MENFNSLKENRASLNEGSCRVALTFDNTSVKVLQLFVTCGQIQCVTTKTTFINLKGSTQMNNQHKAGVTTQGILGIFNMNL